MQLNHLFLFIVQKFQNFLNLFAIFLNFFIQPEHLHPGSEMACPVEYVLLITIVTKVFFQ
jgi:hypothetical protein